MVIDSSEVNKLLPSDVMISIALDIVFAASKGKKQTPKHVGHALTLHRAIRSRKLIL